MSDTLLFFSMKREGFTVGEICQTIVAVKVEITGLPSSVKPKDGVIDLNEVFGTRHFTSEPLRDWCLRPARIRAIEKSGPFWTQFPPSPKVRSFRYDLEHIGGMLDELSDEIGRPTREGRNLREMGMTPEILLRAEQKMINFIEAEKRT